MAEIIRYLNNNGVKTALGNDFNKSSIRRILTNKKYIGIYSYNGKETSGGVPRTIDAGGHEGIRTPDLSHVKRTL